ncbi:MAG: hypothetical protein ACOYK5_08075 [Bacteroidia bacterium]|jgi:hypothetical protein
MKRLLILLCAMGLVAVGCGESASKRNEELVQLHERMLEVHDSVMPLTGSLMSLKQKCIQQADSAVDSTASNQWYLKAKSLENAYTEMMNWMHRYAEIKDTAGVDCLRRELQGIEAVAVHYGHSMKDAAGALEALDSLK